MQIISNNTESDLTDKYGEKGNHASDPEIFAFIEEEDKMEYNKEGYNKEYDIYKSYYYAKQSIKKIGEIYIEEKTNSMNELYLEMGERKIVKIEISKQEEKGYRIIRVPIKIYNIP